MTYLELIVEVKEYYRTFPLNPTRTMIKISGIVDSKNYIEFFLSLH